MGITIYSLTMGNAGFVSSTVAPGFARHSFEFGPGFAVLRAGSLLLKICLDPQEPTFL